MTKAEFENQPWNNADGYSLVLGKVQSGKYLICFDFDDKEAKGLWKEEYFSDCMSYCEKTPHSGYHILMLVDKEPRTIKDYKEVELLSSGHIVHMYNAPIKDLPILSVPTIDLAFQEIIQRYNLKPKHSKSLEEIPIEELLSRNLSEGQRDDTSILIASKLRQLGKTKEECLPILLEWDSKNIPPLGTKIIEEKVDSAYKNPIPYWNKNNSCAFNNITARAEVFDSLMKTEVFVCLPSGELYIYRDGIYVSGGLPDQFIKSKTTEIFEKQYTTYDFLQILDRIKGTCAVASTFFEGVPLNLICLNNGVLDLNTLELKVYSPEYHFLNRIPVDFDPQANCSLITQKLREWLETEDHVKAILEFIGFCLWREYTYEKAFFLIGEGENGKSTFLNLLIAFLGTNNVSHVPVQELGERFKRVYLLGKLANIADELSSKAFADTSKFKELTGRSRISAEKKFVQHSFDFVSYAKQIYATNQLPTITDRTYALFRRPTIFRFDNIFSKENGKRDDHLIEKLTTPEELSGLLNLAIEGLKRLQKSGEFSVQPNPEDTEGVWSFDPVEEFCSLMVREDYQAQVPAKELYSAFHKFCEDKKVPTLSIQCFGLRLQKFVKFHRIKKSKKNTSKEYVYQGIRLRTSEQDENIGGWIDPNE